MSVRGGQPGQIPNWIRENDWSAEKRLEWIRVIMACGPQDWSQYPYATPGYPSPETYAIWCLACCDSREEAAESWEGFCTEARARGMA